MLAVLAFSTETVDYLAQKCVNLDTKLGCISMILCCGTKHKELQSDMVEASAGGKVERKVAAGWLRGNGL